MADNSKIVPNDVYKYRVNLDVELPDVTVYVREGEYSDSADGSEEGSEKLQKLYFDKERINELKKELIRLIEESENPFDIYCVDEDGGYRVTEEMLFKADKSK